MAKYIWQDAMHKVESESLDDDKAIVEALRQMSDGWPRSDRFLPSLKKGLTALFVRDGFPDPGASIFHRGRFWCEILEGERPIGKALSPGWAFIRSQTEPLTPLREAAELYLKTIEVELAIKRGNMEEVFSHSLLLGIAHNQFNSRRLHLKRITIRKKAEQGLRNANYERDAANRIKKMKAQAWKEIAFEIASEFRKKRPDASNSTLASWIVRHWPSDSPEKCPSQSTVRQALKEKR